MAGVEEGTSFENPSFDPYSWNDDDDDDTPLIKKGNGAANETGSFMISTPAFGEYQTRVREEIEMKTMQQVGGADTSYVKTSFGAPKSSERAWVATKDLFPKMSSSELEVSYNTKGKLQVKMFGAGKKTYNLMTTDRGTGREHINKSLPKEIQNALGETKYKMQREDLKNRWMKKHKKSKKKTKILKLLKNQMIARR